MTDEEMRRKEAEAARDALAAENARLREELEACRFVVVQSIAFYGRDAGSDRLDGTMEQLCRLWVQADNRAIAALAAGAQT